MAKNPELVNDKRRRLIDSLAQKTEEGKIAWASTIDDDTFRVDFSKNSIKISEDGEDYQVYVINSDGNVVETFNDNELDGRATGIAANAENKSFVYYRKLKDLYFSARRISLGSDEVLDDIIGELAGAQKK